jgi:hypothetical protein
MVLLASTYDQSRFLRAEDLKQEKILRIKAVTIEKINDRTGPVEKLVVWFTNIEKGLVLNKTTTARSAAFITTIRQVGPASRSFCIPP